MRLAQSVSCLFAAGCAAVVVATMAAAAAPGADEPAPIGNRVFFDRDALSPHQRALLAPGLDAPRIVPLPENDTRNEAVSGTAARRGGGGTVVASLGSPSALPWAPTPAVPPLLSKPVPRGDAPETKLPVLEDPTTRALEQALDRKPGRSHALEKRKAVSERGRLPLSQSPLKRMSTRWTDPLADLELGVDPSPEFIMPFANGRVTSLFNQGRRHPAIDLAGALGSPVFATTSQQTVVFAARRGGYGNAVITRDVYGWTHLYGHLKSITAKVGQVLDQRDKLGHLGSTGHSTGPHVHYEVRDGRGAHVNPVTLLFPSRNAAKGLAWADVGQFGASAQLASRTASADRLASASPIEAVPRRLSAKPKSGAKQPSAVRYAHAARHARVRRASSDEDD